VSEIEPGHYWARWKASTGLWMWHPIDYQETEGGGRVFQIGSNVPTEPDKWEFGPRLEPPAEEA